MLAVPLVRKTTVEKKETNALFAAYCRGEKEGGLCSEYIDYNTLLFNIYSKLSRYIFQLIIFIILVINPIEMEYSIIPNNQN